MSAPSYPVGREPWWVHHPDHMKGWEAFGVTDGEPTVRRLGIVTIKGGKATTDERPGDEPFHRLEVFNGVAGIHLSTHGDDPDLGAYLHVIGTDKGAVAARWRLVADMWSVQSSSWWSAVVVSATEGDNRD